MKIGAIIQARTSSTRLPGKVLKEMPYASGITVLQQIIRRLRRSKRLDQLIVATSQEREDDEIAKVSEKENVKAFRGSLHNVLERYYLAAIDNQLDVIVRITADCPCVDAEIVDRVIEKHLTGESDFTSNVVKRTFADGFDVEVLSFNALKRVKEAAQDNAQREHVTLYIYRNPDKFKIVNVEADGRLYAPDRRVTLDTPQDYALLCAIYDALYYQDEYFPAGRIMELFDEKSWLERISATSDTNVES